MNCIQRKKLTVAEQKAMDREINRQLGDYIVKHEKKHRCGDSVRIAHISEG